MENSQNKKLFYCHINESLFFILVISHINNLYSKDNDND